MSVGPLHLNLFSPTKLVLVKKMLLSVINSFLVLIACPHLQLYISLAG